MNYDPSKKLTLQGSEAMRLEDFLAANLTMPVNKADSIDLSATNIMKTLGISVVGRAFAIRATKWLQDSGYRQIKGGYNFKVKFVEPDKRVVPRVLV